MWPWIKRWRDWAMNELWPMSRIVTGPQALHYSYEKAGLTLPGQPIPWNAESVVVETLAMFPTGRAGIASERPRRLTSSLSRAARAGRRSVEREHSHHRRPDGPP